VWFFVALLLLACLGPVVNSEKWDSWDDGRKLLKVINWAIYAAAALACFWRAKMPGVRHVFRLMSVVPWVMAFVCLFMLFIFTRGVDPIATLSRAGYAGTSAAVWFVFLKRYPFVLCGDKFSDAEWRKLTNPSKPETSR
jgi:hypothetical protein